MSGTLDFAAGKARYRRAKEAAHKRDVPHLVRLRGVIDACQQAHKSRQLLDGGYVGPGVRAEVEQAQQLPSLLSEAGRIVQEMMVNHA